MNSDIVYETARYGVATETEQLIERVQLIDRDGELWLRVTDGSEALCARNNVARLISTVPSLNEVRAI